ncbi:MAG: DUF1294 domain-containing protein, partial [Muribaculaceae bacterium]|nr:DUF1294 domain-containing protein [Muribaculaceae bacterium]
MSAVFFAILILSVVTFIMFWMDKRYAQNGHWRIPEKTLLFLAAAGGSAGALIAMEIFRHKTQKEAFVKGIPYII